MTVKDIIKICNGKLLCGDENIVCENFSKDTRTINFGDVYVGIKGENFDGNLFYKDAIKNGASVCILDNENIVEEKLGTIIIVNDSILALGALASYKRDLYDIPVIAITGSVGKTSVKDMIHEVLKMKYNVLCTKENYNNNIGVPLTILGLKNHNALIVEMGMNHMKELSYLSKIAKPTMALITNIGTAHIGNLGSRENILKAKLEVLDGMNGGKLFINNDDDMLQKVQYGSLVTIGIKNKSNFMATDIKEDAFSSRFKINNQDIKLNVGSNAFVYNALFAYAVGEYLGVSKENIEAALENFKLSPHRLEKFETKKYTIIDDTYNASLDSVKNSLGLLSKVLGRKVFVFADILEIDNFAKEIHEEVAENIIENNIDITICVGNQSKYTYEKLKSNNKETYYFESNSDLINNLNSILKEKDTILIKGSHSMKLIEVVNFLKK